MVFEKNSINQHYQCQHVILSLLLNCYDAICFIFAHVNIVWLLNHFYILVSIEQWSMQCWRWNTRKKWINLFCKFLIIGCCLELKLKWVYWSQECVISLRYLSCWSFFSRSFNDRPLLYVFFSCHIFVILAYMITWWCTYHDMMYFIFFKYIFE